jgi:hypothetical protein
MSRCDAEAFLRSRGPCAVPLRICCLAALIGVRDDGRPSRDAFGCPELATTTGLLATAASGAGGAAAAPGSSAELGR